MTEQNVADFARYLEREEYAPGSVELYLRSIRKLYAWLEGRPVTKEEVIAWKDHLVADGYAPVTVNAMLAAVNRCFRFIGREDCRVKALRIQKRVFRDAGRELSKEDYFKLRDAAEENGQERLALLIETICATGIRVSEVQYVTVGAAKQGRAEVSLKGKIRTILLPGKLCRKLIKYARNKKIARGEIFLTARGKRLSRKQIWAELKRLCKRAGVEASKVFPHNLRHLFAQTFYKACRDIAKLADVLGHSSIETTRIYLISTGAEHARQIARLGLVT